MPFTTKTLASPGGNRPVRQTFVSMLVDEFQIVSAMRGATTPRENDGRTTCLFIKTLIQSYALESMSPC